MTARRTALGRDTVTRTLYLGHCRGLTSGLIRPARSNDSGSADGYEVCSNARGWVDEAGVPRDFVRIV